MKKIYSTLFVLFSILGCNSHPKVDNHKFITAEDVKTAYGKKYHFILETPYYSSSPHNLPDVLPKLKYKHYHIYVNEKKELTGDRVLFATENMKTPKQLDKNTIFNINKDRIEIRNLKKCDSVTKKCWESELNREYLLVLTSQINVSSKFIPYASSYYYK